MHVCGLIWQWDVTLDYQMNTRHKFYRDLGPHVASNNPTLAYVSISSTSDNAVYNGMSGKLGGKSSNVGVDDLDEGSIDE